MTQREIALMMTWARRGALALLGLAMTAPASAQVGSPSSYASLGTLNPAAGTYTLDTGAQTLTIGSTVYKGVVQSQPGGPNVIVFAFSNVAIGDGVTINATGSQPFALLSQSNVSFSGSGTVNLSSFATSPDIKSGQVGAGGGYITPYTQGGNGQGPGGGAGATNDSIGGGGGGFGGAGGRGGATTGGGASATGGAAGGGTYGSSSVLMGGSAGGTNRDFYGGPGGGGAQVGATGTISLTGTGGILANGADGQGTVTKYSGGGGGSGGQVILTAQAIVVPAAGAQITANGGNGGADPSINSLVGSGYGGGGGGGGGGRITIQVATFNATSLASGLSASGGSGGTGGIHPGVNGGAGVVGITAGTSVVNNGEALTITAGKVGAANFTSGNYVVGAGGQLSATGTAQSIGSLAGAGNVNLMGSALTVGVGNATSTFAGTVTSDSSLTKAGAGSFTVAGSESYGGAVAVNAGILNVATGGSLATTAALTNAGTINVAANASVVASGGFVNNAGGRINLTDPAASLAGGTFTNAAGATLGGSGTVAASLANAGTLRVGANDDLALTGATNTNAGTVSLQGGTLEVAQALANNAGGLITGRGALYTNQVGGSGVGLTNLGAMNFSGGTTDVYGLVQNGVGGSIISSGNGVLTFHNGLNFLAGSTIQTDAGSTTVVFGPTRLKGNFTGGGTVSLDGTISIDPQLITFGGNLTLTDNTVFNMEVQGPLRGTNYDSLAVAGLATLAGTLNFLVDGGFVPTVGEEFLAVSYGSHTGTIRTINAFGLPTGDYLTADYRADGLYLIVNSNAVPEPSSLALLGLGVAGAACVGRRRRGPAGAAR